MQAAGDKKKGMVTTWIGIGCFGLFEYFIFKNIFGLWYLRGFSIEHSYNNGGISYKKCMCAISINVSGFMGEVRLSPGPQFQHKGPLLHRRQ